MSSQIANNARRSVLAAAAGSVLIGFLQSSSGAIARTLRVKPREVVSVKDFGAAGDGVTDDAPAIEAICLALFNAGGGELYFPPGVYLLATLSTDPDAHDSYITARDHVSFRGDGVGVSVLKVAKGQNALYAARIAPNIISTKQAGLLRGVAVSGLSFDWNGANNLLKPGMTARNNAAFITINGVEKFLFEHCEVIETPGNQCVFIKNQNYGAVNGTGAIIRDCVFLDCGSGLIGNYNLDHSSVYLQCDDSRIENCVFAASQKVAGSAYELHGSRNKGRNNRSSWYSIGFYLSSDSVAISDCSVIGDSHRNVERAFVVSAPAVGVDNIKVSKCYFVAAPGLAFGTTTYFVNGATIAACSSMDVTENLFIGGGYANQRFMQQYKIARLNFIDNTVKDFNGPNVYGLISGNVDIGTGRVIDSLRVSGNLFYDVSFPVYFNATTLEAGDISITGNVFRRTAADSNAVITLQFTKSSGKIEGNVYSNNYSVKYSGTSHGVRYLEPITESSILSLSRSELA